MTSSDSRLKDARTPTGPARGALAGTYPDPSLAAPEAVHLVGPAGEPGFATGASNSSSGEVPAGFYKDGFGIVHVQGTVDAHTGTTIFTLPLVIGLEAKPTFRSRPSRRGRPSRPTGRLSRLTAMCPTTEAPETSSSALTASLSVRVSRRGFTATPERWLRPPRRRTRALRDSGGRASGRPWGW